MDTRTALLDSAEAAARQSGFDAFSYADLSRAVGIRKASIHYHFPVKADLALSLIERYTARVLDQLTAIEAGHRDAADMLHAYRRLYRDALAGGTRLCLCVALSAGRNSLSDPVLTQLDAFHTSSIAWLTRVYERAVEDGTVFGVFAPETEAAATLALMEGAQLVARAAESVSRFDQATAALGARLVPAEMDQA